MPTTQASQPGFLGIFTEALASVASMVAMPLHLNSQSWKSGKAISPFCQTGLHNFFAVEHTFYLHGNLLF